MTKTTTIVSTGTNKKTDVHKTGAHQTGATKCRTALSIAALFNNGKHVTLPGFSRDNVGEDYTEHIRKCWKNLCFVPPKSITAEMCILALTYDYSKNANLDDDTINNQWRAIQYIPEHILTDGMCWDAIYGPSRSGPRNWKALQFIPAEFQSDLMCERAVWASLSAVYFIAVRDVPRCVARYVKSKISVDYDSMCDLIVMEEFVNNGTLDRDVVEWFIRTHWELITLNGAPIYDHAQSLFETTHPDDDVTISFLCKPLVLKFNCA
jgi:hypothetical protein